MHLENSRGAAGLGRLEGRRFESSEGSRGGSSEGSRLGGLEGLERGLGSRISTDVFGGPGLAATTDTR